MSHLRRRKLMENPTENIVSSEDKIKIMKEELEKKVATPVPMYDRNFVLDTLQKYVIATVSREAITSDSIISAQHNVIIELQSKLDKWMKEVSLLDNKLKQFYMACQREGILVTTTSKGIELKCTK